MRKILNEDQVFKMLETRGFKKYFMEDMSVLEQIALFGSASCVVLPHGASAANLFFSPRDTRVIQFWPNRLFNSHKIYPKKLTYNNLYEKTAENDCMIVNLNRLSHIVDGTLT